MTALKSGVKLAGLQPQMVLGLLIASSIADDMDLDLVVTSANDGKHMVGSKHGTGEAIDLRTHDWPTEVKLRFVEKLRACLTAEFDLLFEDQDGPNEHVHVEFDPK